MYVCTYICLPINKSGKILYIYKQSINLIQWATFVARGHDYSANTKNFICGL